jgi:hypothetical protein
MRTSQPAVARIEAGHVAATLTSLQKIADRSKATATSPFTLKQRANRSPESDIESRSSEAVASLLWLVDNLLFPAIRFALAQLAPRGLQLEESGGLIRKSGMIRQSYPHALPVGERGGHSSHTVILQVAPGRIPA